MQLTIFIEGTVAAFEAQRSLAERALQQVSDESLHRALDSNTNSIAIIVQHVGGNLKSRWTEFLDSDGQKPWRNRDDEFVDGGAPRTVIMATWDAGWTQLFTSLRALADADMERTITIRGEAHTVPLAIQRSLAHTSYHVGQIVQLSRHLAGDGPWDTLTLPRAAPPR